MKAVTRGMIVFLGLLCLLSLSSLSCDDESEADAGGNDTADAAISCGPAPSDGPSCAAATCPAACDQPSACGHFCGGGECYACSSGGAWTRVVYSCLGRVCTAGGADAGVDAAGASADAGQ